MEQDINYLNIFPYAENVAKIRLLEVQPVGGHLKTGAYTILVRYIDELGTPTNFLSASQQVAVGPQSVDDISTFRGDEGETRTGYTIRLAVQNIDRHYSHIQLAVIPQYNGSVGIPLLLAPRAIISSEMHFIISGGERATETTLEELLIDKASYARARTLTQVDGRLYMGNMQRHDEVDYQHYANAIEVEVKISESGKIRLGAGQMRVSSAPGDYGDPLRLSYYSKGFKRGEVYAFYISFLLKDGYETAAFHIPGRAPTTFTYKGSTWPEDGVVPPSESLLRNIAGQDEIGNERAHWYQFMSVPHPEYGTGFWENRNEFYPATDDWDVWDVDESGEPVHLEKSLAGLRVRHHQMPDVEYENYLTPATGLTFPQTPQQNIKVLGVQFNNIKIPNEIRERVAAVRIHYAKRRGIDERIADQSFGLPVTAEQDNMSSGTVGHGVSTYWPQDPPHSSVSTTVLSRDNVILHPFNLLRTKDNIQDISYLKVIGRSPTLGEWGREQPNFGADFRTVYDNLFDLEYFEWGPPSDDKRFFRINARSYIPSYGFAEEGANSLVRLSDDQFVRDYDNTNGEEKIVVNIFPAQANTGEPFPNFLYEIRRYRENMFFGFDLQELVFTGYQTLDVANFDPTSQKPAAEYGKYSTGPVFGGDTFIGVWVSRHSWWLHEGNPVWQSLRYTAVETKAYPDYRSPGTQAWEQWIPGTTRQRENYAAIIWKDGKPNLENKEGEVFPDNPIRYNIDFLMGETYKPAFPRPKVSTYIQKLPTRIIRSRQIRGDQTIDRFREFLDQDFLDLPAHRGQLIRLTNLSGILIPHMESSLFRTRAREELQTGDFRAFLGTGDIFSVTPEELYETDIGRGGIHAYRAGMVTEYGYFFVDHKARKVFHITPEGALEVSSQGLEKFFKENLGFALEEAGFTQFDAISPYFGIEVTWDPVNKRYLLSKKDLKLNVEDVEVPTYSEVSSVYPVPDLQMLAVGARTEDLSVVASWYTTRVVQGQIDWAITLTPYEPDLSEFSTTPYTQDHVHHHVIPFPESFMGAYHWFRARIRNSSGQVMESPVRGIYFVADELTIRSSQIYTVPHFSHLETPTVFSLGNSKMSATPFAVDNLIVLENFSPVISLQALDPGSVQGSTKGFYTKVTIQ